MKPIKLWIIKFIENSPQMHQGDDCLKGGISGVQDKVHILDEKKYTENSIFHFNHWIRKP